MLGQVMFDVSGYKARLDARPMAKNRAQAYLTTFASEYAGDPVVSMQFQQAALDVAADQDPLSDQVADEVENLILSVLGGAARPASNGRKWFRRSTGLSGVAIDPSLVDPNLSDQIATRPMTHAMALHAILQASTALEAQVSATVSNDPLSASMQDELIAAVALERLKNLLSDEVGPAPDPLPDDVAGDVERAVRQTLGFRNAAAQNADKAAASIWHWLGVPVDAVPNTPSFWPPWLPDLSTVLLFGGLTIGGWFVYKTFRSRRGAAT
jgi:hypothetical protein